LPAFDLGKARFVNSARVLPAAPQLFDVSSPLQHSEHFFLRLFDELWRVASAAGQTANLHTTVTEHAIKSGGDRAC